MMHHLPVACALALFSLATLACAGSPEPSTHPPRQALADTAAVPAPSVTEAARQALTIALSGMASQTPELIDVSDDGNYVALRISSARDEMSQAVARCDYPGLADDVDGIDLALVDFEAQSVQRWTVYKTPSSSDSTCTEDAAAHDVLTEAKEAIQGAGLDPALRQSWLLPRPFEAGADLVGRPPTEARAVELASGEVLDITLEHVSDSGYHTYSATVLGSSGRAHAMHSPNPGMGGSGDLEVRGAATSEGGTVVLFEARHGPAGMWSSWMLTPPL